MKACAQGPGTKFIKGRAGKTTKIAAAIEADLDHNGALEVVAFIDCLPPGWGDNPPRQVVAFERRADGTFATMGVVVEEVPAGDPSQNDNTIEDVPGMQSAPAGGIQIEVGDPATLYQDTGTSPGLYQQRTYGWNGTAIVQTSGSSSFVVPPGTIRSRDQRFADDVCEADQPRTGGIHDRDRSQQWPDHGRASVGIPCDGIHAGHMRRSGEQSGADLRRRVVGARRHQDRHVPPFGPDCADCSLGGSLQVRVGDQKYGETPSFSSVFR